MKLAEAIASHSKCDSMKVIKHAQKSSGYLDVGGAKEASIRYILTSNRLSRVVYICLKPHQFAALSPHLCCLEL